MGNPAIKRTGVDFSIKLLVTPRGRRHTPRRVSNVGLARSHVHDRGASMVRVVSSPFDNHLDVEKNPSLLWLPKFHLNGASLLASIGPFDVEAWERRKVLGVQRGQDEMVRECCDADEAIQHAHPMT
jgi:hypothetical protein